MIELLYGHDAAVLAAKFPPNTDRDSLSCRASSVGYFCTRTAKHDGPHVAHGGYSALAMWDTTPNPGAQPLPAKR